LFNFFFKTKKVPKDAESFKIIGEYCLTTKKIVKNCVDMLDLLKKKLKNCQTIKNSNTEECKQFNGNFCGAFPSFPCCAEVNIFC
jgi:hypothetical protein